MTSEASPGAGVRLVSVTDVRELRTVSALFAEVWGRTPEGVPMHSETLRSLVHAGGLVNAAHDERTGDLAGAAVLGRDVPGACYGYLAAVRPGRGDRGIGRALKQHQRAWALDRGMTVMTWTYDPLVARNGRFNLVRLGAVAGTYEPGFYGQMDDGLNGTDVGDRLVVRWELDSDRAVSAAAGATTLPAAAPDPATAGAGARTEEGPDGLTALVATATERWIRVPADVVELRRTDTSRAAAWRALTRTWFQDAFAAGLVADSVSRTGWYHLAARTSGGHA